MTTAQDTNGHLQVSTSKTSTSWAYSICEELGLTHVWHSPRDVHLLFFQRLIRMAAYGATTLVLVVFLRELGISESRIGFFMSGTLLGDVAVTFTLALYGDRLGRRAVLACGSLAMTGSGLVFALFENYWVLLAASVIGVITPSGSDVGVFRVLEESVLAHLSAEEDRATIYSWYNIAARLGTAVGMVVCGWVMTLLHEQQQWPWKDCYRAVFAVYALIGLVKFLTCCVMSSDCEVEDPAEDTTVAHTATEASALLADQSVLIDQSTAAPPRKKRWSPVPELKPEHTTYLIKLCILYAIDYVGNGMCSFSWIAYYFNSVFHLADSTIGSIFFIVGILATFAGIASASMARRMGNAKTMFYSMVVCNIALVSMGATYNLAVTIIATIIKLSAHTMDSGPNSAFLAAAFEPRERTAIMGIINIVKTLASSIGPTITGFMVENSLFWLVFVSSGALKLGFDFTRYYMFKDHPCEIRAREERERRRRLTDD